MLDLQEFHEATDAMDVESRHHQDDTKANHSNQLLHEIHLRADSTFGDGTTATHRARGGI